MLTALFRFIVLCLCVFSSLGVNWQKVAHEWTATHLANASEHDKAQIIELFEKSYKHPQATLEAQEKLANGLKTIWLMYYHLLATRRNPSCRVEHTVASNEFKQIIENLFASYQASHVNGKEYAQILDRVINKHSLENDNLVAEVERIRDLSRKARIEALHKEGLNMHEILHDLTHSFGGLRKSAHLPLPEDIIAIREERGIVDAVTAALEYALFYSFVDFDRAYIKANAACAEAFEKTHIKVNAVWKLMETARRDFYYAFYQAAINAASTKDNFSVYENS